MTPTEKRAFWKKHVEAWRQSNLSQRAYCLQNELSLVRFTYWVKRLNTKADFRGRFIPVRITPSVILVRVRLPAGLEVEVPVSALEEVLPILSRAAQGAA